MKVLVTGATGFVGRALLAHLLTRPQFEVRAAVRASSVERLPAGVEYVQVGDLDADTDWHAALAGMDAVVHLAARVHVMHEQAHDPLQAFRQVNVVGSTRLAQMAAQAGVQRLVFLSSIKVNGESTPAHQPFCETSPCAPQDGYSISKLETEQALHDVARDSGLALTILRPPLVYGHGCGARDAGDESSALEDRGLPVRFQGGPSYAGCVCAKAGHQPATVPS